ncbi:HlyD family efflux transporter periplasmic adaptor subunit [Bacillus alkalicellulosilyticus]|uniref:HlyD family efflux transporter periplasmic adaptor subunit n=1 Tax=Alkalihalobacterium alkalicellulosilyticum TaxID=1912214 RepID=UPI00099736D7|nr:HlyD family efflux transporter periplasmic adaptor subunit [Bacillus alkalicellulosilyticus]
MKNIVRDISELTDSRELLESKPHPFVPIFITIFVLLLFSALTWSFFGEIDEVAKASGMVRPNESVSTVQAPVFGQIEEVFFNEGQWVEKGEILFTLDKEELEKELDMRLAEMTEAEEEIELLQLYKKSIETNENLFSTQTERTTYYYDLVDQFFLQSQQIDAELKATQLELSQAKNELERSKGLSNATLEGQQREEKQIKRNLELEKENLLSSLDGVLGELQEEEILLNAVKQDIGKLTGVSEVRAIRYNMYQTQKSKLEDMIQEQLIVEQSQKQLSKNEEITATQFENGSSKSLVKEIEDLENQFKMEIHLNLEQLTNQKKQLEENINLVNEQMTVTRDDEAIRLQREHVSQQQEDIKEQEQMLTETGTLMKKQFEMNTTVEINTAIREQTQYVKTLQETINQLQFTVENRNIIAPTSGIVNVLKELTTGEFVQSGDNIVAIIPDDESEFLMSIVVPNHEIGKISIGQPVNFHFTAFPKQNFGHITGEIKSISSDSIIHQEGISYYTVEAIIQKEPLVNRKGQEGEVKVGMTADAFVIVDTKKVIHYLLEKINMKD